MITVYKGKQEINFLFELQGGDFDLFEKLNYKYNQSKNENGLKRL